MLKNLKSLFIVEDETIESVSSDKTAASSQNNITPTPEPNLTEPSSNYSSKPSVGVDQKIVDKLLKAIDANNLEGFDYLEFKNSVKALSDMALSEEMKYKSAFATASTMGVTVEKLLETVKHYLGVLETENKTFNNTYKSQFDQKISQKEKEIAKMEEEITVKKLEIERLTKEIETSMAEIETSRTKLVDTRQNLDSTQNIFKSSYEFLTNQINEDVSKIEKYLKKENNS